MNNDALADKPVSVIPAASQSIRVKTIVEQDETPTPQAQLIPLKTVLELRAENAVVEVYVTVVPVKLANTVIS